MSGRKVNSEETKLLWYIVIELRDYSLSDNIKSMHVGYQR